MIAKFDPEVGVYAPDDFESGKFTIVDALLRLFPGQWFGWKDPKVRTYDNIIIHKNDAGKAFLKKFGKLPTEAELMEGAAYMQAKWDAHTAPYRVNRKSSYPFIEDQLDMLWHAINNGNLDKTSEFYTALKSVKDRFPKG